MLCVFVIHLFAAIYLIFHKIILHFATFLPVALSFWWVPHFATKSCFSIYPLPNASLVIVVIVWTNYLYVIFMTTDKICLVPFFVHQLSELIWPDQSHSQMTKMMDGFLVGMWFKSNRCYLNEIDIEQLERRVLLIKSRLQSRSQNSRSHNLLVIELHWTC